jgi:hypothetical protein
LTLEFPEPHNVAHSESAESALLSTAVFQKKRAAMIRSSDRRGSRRFFKLDKRELNQHRDAVEQSLKPGTKAPRKRLN